MKSGPLRILLVEDQRADAVLLEAMLQSVPAGPFEVRWDDRLAKALDRLQREAPDAVLLDLTLPDSKGLATLERLLGASAAIPIVVLTGVEDEDIAIQAIRHGAQDYLVKGRVDGRAVARAIRYAIDRHELKELQKREQERLAAYAAAQVAVNTIDAMSVGVMLARMDGTVFTVNPAFEAMTGYTNAELSGHSMDQTIDLLVREGDRLRIRELTHRALQGQAVDSSSSTLIRKTGEEVEVVGDLAFIKDPQGSHLTIVVTLTDVTGLRRTEDQLRKSQAGLLEAQRIAQIGNWDWNVLTNDLTWSDEIYRIFGLSPRTFGATYDAFVLAIHPDDRAVVNDLVQKALRNELPYNLDHRIIRPDGSERIVHEQGEVFRDETGNPVRMVGTVQDITEHTMAERQEQTITALLGLFARKSSKQEYLDEALKVVAQWSGCRCVGIRLRDAEGNIPYVSVTGFPPSFVEAENCLRLSQATCVCSRVMAGVPELQDFTCMTPAGSFRCGNAHQFLDGLSEGQRERYRGRCAQSGMKSLAVIPIRRRGQVVGAIHMADERAGMVPLERIGFIETLMAPMLGEAISRFDAEESLRQSETRYRALVENLPAITYLAAVDNVGATLYVSPQVERILGFAAADWRADPQMRHQQIHPEDRERVTAELARACQSRSSFSMEYRMRSWDGRDVWVRDDAAVLVDANGSPRLLQGVIYDISERRRAEADLHAYQDELRSLSSRLSLAEERARRELAVALHDTVVQTLALSKINLGALSQLVTQRQARRALAEIRALFEKAVQQTRTLCFELSPPILYELGLGAALEWLGEEYQRRLGVACRFRESEDIGVIDESVSVLLFQSVRELLTNIGKHAAASHVDVSLRRDGDRVVVRVVDDGKGFDCQNGIQAAIKKNSLGLFSIRERMKDIGGAFTLESAPGRGTTATLTAPSSMTTGAPGTPAAV